MLPNVVGYVAGNNNMTIVTPVHTTEKQFAAYPDAPKANGLLGS